jgi:molybdopterin-containing oxidoreductase family iron-sulfur binding subunit
MFYDETSALSTWHVPQAHYVEAWGDARAYDGTVSIIQPPIGPLYDTVRSVHDIVSVVAGDTPSAFSVVRGYWFQNSGVPFAEFDLFWRRALHDGVIADSAPEPASPSLRGDLASALEEAETPAASGLELIFRPAPGVWDGRFAYNSWLLEMPDPISKVSWDMVALMSPATAEELGVSREDLVELTFNGNTMLAPAWPLPGHVDGAVTVALGYGRGLSSELEDNYTFNAYTLRNSGAMWFGGGLTVNNTGDTYSLAAIRSDMEVRDEETEFIHAGTLDEYNSDAAAIIKDDKVISLLDAEFEYDGYAWGMSIDLTSCIGCNACLVACQMENNIPAVGKTEVARDREMHWIRVDRYFEEGDDGQVETKFQPVPCMQCEKAPCEQVCPVHATVHDSEGLNNMVYNRCIGTRYCSANCPYTVRRFNFFDYVSEDPINVEWRNPDVTVRVEGVMEKCTYCVQRINAARIEANNEGRQIRDGEIVTACAGACPTEAITFGNINDPDAQVTQLKALPHDYGLLAKLNTQPRTTYLARLTNPNPALQGSEGEA